MACVITTQLRCCYSELSQSILNMHAWVLIKLCLQKQCHLQTPVLEVRYFLVIYSIPSHGFRPTKRSRRQRKASGIWAPLPPATQEVSRSLAAAVSILLTQASRLRPARAWVLIVPPPGSHAAHPDHTCRVIVPTCPSCPTPSFHLAIEPVAF